MITTVAAFTERHPNLHHRLTGVRIRQLAHDCLTCVIAGDAFRCRIDALLPTAAASVLPERA
jgi:hypothetical protein